MPSFDDLQRRCPRLGGPVSFGYCRTNPDGADRGPCFKVLDCWWERFDVVGYLEPRLSREAMERLRSATPPNKVASLVDLIAQAKKRKSS